MKKVAHRKKAAKKKVPRKKKSSSTPYLNWQEICSLRMMYLWKEYPFRDLFRDAKVDCPQKPMAWLADNAHDATQIADSTDAIVKKSDYKDVLISLSKGGLPAKLTHEFAALTHGCQNFEYKINAAGLLPKVDSRKRAAQLKRLERDLSIPDPPGRSDDIRKVLTAVKSESAKISQGKRGPREEFYKKDSMLDLFVYLHVYGGIKAVKACKLIEKILVCFGHAPSSVREDHVREMVNRAAYEMIELLGKPRN